MIPRAVLDANIFISAFLKPSGPQAQLLDAAFDGKYAIVLSNEIFDEICVVLQREKIVERLSMPTKEVRENLKRIATIASWTDGSITVDICEDPDDNIYLSCAKEAQADFLVSGDQHLLQLKQFEKTAIVSTRGFLDHLKIAFGK